MGFFSWCTSDTKKSIAAWMEGYDGCPQTVYLLNPFGSPYQENCYDGYGRFGGNDVYALVAKWNAPDLCKNEKGEWKKDAEIRCIGIKLACYEENHVTLKYPIKIVEDPSISYDEAEISPGCPFQGYFYEESLKKIEKEIEKTFKRFDTVKKVHEDIKVLMNDTKKFEDTVLKCLEKDSKSIATVGAHDEYADKLLFYCSMNNFLPENIYKLIAEKGSKYHLQELCKNKVVSEDVLKILISKAKDYMLLRILERTDISETLVKCIEERTKEINVAPYNKRRLSDMLNNASCLFSKQEISKSDKINTPVR